MKTPLSVLVSFEKIRTYTYVYIYVYIYLYMYCKSWVIIDDWLDLACRVVWNSQLFVWLVLAYLVIGVGNWIKFSRCLKSNPFCFLFFLFFFFWGFFGFSKNDPKTTNSINERHTFHKTTFPVCDFWGDSISWHVKQSCTPTCKRAANFSFSFKFFFTKKNVKRLSRTNYTFFPLNFRLYHLNASWSSIYNIFSLWIFK